MPEKKSKGPNKPGANLPAPLKIPSQIDWSANPDSQIREKFSERLVKLLKHYEIKDSNPNKWLLLSYFLADELGLFRVLRGSHETALLDAGVPVHVVAARCGHEPAVLLRNYAKRTKKADASAAAAISALSLLR
jgi:hypothetical protein